MMKIWGKNLQIMSQLDDQVTSENLITDFLRFFLALKDQGKEQRGIIYDVHLVQENFHKVMIGSKTFSFISK